MIEQQQPAPPPRTPIGNGRASTSRCNYNGKYKAKVVDTSDPLLKGRLLCEVAALPVLNLNWATPCVPYAGEGQGLFALPPMGSDVWIEFENADPDKPIWSGGYWEAGLEPSMPEAAPEAPELVNALKSKFCRLVLNDVPGVGGVTLGSIAPVAPGAVTMTMDAAGLTLSVDELSLTMNPETGITLTAGETVLNLSPTGVTLDTPKITATAVAEAGLTTPKMSVTGDSAFTGRVTVTGDVSATGAVSVTGDSSLTGALSVTGDVSATGAFAITGDATLTGDTTHVGETVMSGGTTMTGDAVVVGGLEVVGDVVAPTFMGALVPPLPI